MSSDIVFKLSTDGIRGRGVEVTPDQIRRLPNLLYQEMYTEFGRIGQVLLFELKFYFFKMIHERPRNESYSKGRAEPLLSRMVQAFKQEIIGTDGVLTLNVFDLQHMDMATRGEGFNTGSEGWFIRFADGHLGRRHGGVNWGFVPYDLAMQLAKEAADKYISTARKKQAWLMEMSEVFKGRHGEGIMCRLDMPMFNLFPQFGKVGDFVQQHPGFYSWPAIGLVGQQMQRKDGYVADMIRAAMDRAVSKM